VVAEQRARRTQSTRAPRERTLQGMQRVVRTLSRAVLALAVALATATVSAGCGDGSGAADPGHSSDRPGAAASSGGASSPRRRASGRIDTWLRQERAARRSDVVRAMEVETAAASAAAPLDGVPSDQASAPSPGAGGPLEPGPGSGNAADVEREALLTATAAPEDLEPAEDAPRKDDPRPAPPLPEGLALARSDVTPETRSRQSDRPHPSGDVWVYEDGRRIRRTTQAEAERDGLTVVDLGDDWTPYLLTPLPELGEAGEVPYAETYRRLADARFGDDERFDRARGERFLELFGIAPTFRVLAARLADDERHACHDAVEDDALVTMTRRPSPWGDLEARQRLAQQHRQTRARIERLRARIDAVRKDGGSPSQTDLATLRALEHRFEALDANVGPVLAVQGHLHCEGLLSERAPEGVFESHTVAGLRAYQRLHMIPSWGELDGDTRATMRTDSRELDLRATLRALRERVVDAAGLIEDGSAGNAWGTVLGRTLDASDLRATRSMPPLEGAAPDLVSAATEAAANALGLWNAESARRFFEALPDTPGLDGEPSPTGRLRVALRLPPPPPWHTPRMTLRAVIDRGDVWYDPPFDARGRPVPQPVETRPTLVLFATHEGREIPLVRWNTTIGGWKPEQLPGRRVLLVYKNSDVGPRVWRDLVAAPAWLPPPSTPDEELVRRDALRGWRVHRDAFGPGFASAYGLMMLVHHQPIVPASRRHRPDAAPVLWDRGIRTHGSASYTSILRGTSHGCHRLFNHLAIRLGNFLLAHRDHARLGPERVRYLRRFSAKGQEFTLRIDDRGVRTVLEPPVPVLVREGNVLGRRREPFGKPRPLARRRAARVEATTAARDD
jgi:hypothetical protein